MLKLLLTSRLLLKSKLLENATQTLEISEGHEQTVHFKLRAKSVLAQLK